MISIQQGSPLSTLTKDPVAAKIHTLLEDHSQEIEILAESAVREFYPHFTKHLANDGILRSGMLCSIVNTAIGLLLTKSGYETELMFRSFPDGEICRPTTDHFILTVKNNDKRIIVDGNYYPFIRCIGLEPKRMPTSDFLVFREYELDSVTSTLAKLRGQNPRESLFIGVYSFMAFDEGRELVQIEASVTDLKAGFRQLWDIKQEDYMKRVSPEEFASLLEDTLNIEEPRTLLSYMAREYHRQHRSSETNTTIYTGRK